MANILDDISNLLYNPSAIQSKVLELLSKGSEGKVDIPDPTNPFVFLVESNALIGSGIVQEFGNNIKKLYPHLAENKEDLYHHLSDNELQDIFASPSTGKFRFFLSIDEIKNNIPLTNNYYELLIPKLTKITVNDIVFTVLNDIVIRYYDSRKTFVKLVGNNIGISHDNDIICPSGIITDSNLNEWLIFDVDIQQLNYTIINDTIINSKPFYKRIPIENQYAYAEAYAYSPTNGSMIKLNKTYSSFVYNPAIPTVYLKPIGKELIVEIPLIYTSNNVITGDFKLDLFTTHGELDMPLENYSMSDFSISFPENIDDPRFKPLLNMNVLTKGIGFTYGGRNELTFEELKNKIIYHSTGDNLLPITEDEIKEELSQIGYELINKVDTILDRIYIADKKISSLGFDVNVLADVFSENIVIRANNIDNIYIKQDGPRLIINPFTVFELMEGKLRPLTVTELEEINEMEKDELLTLISQKKYFYNIYKYVCDFENKLKVRAYDLNMPSVYNNRNIVINSGLNTLTTLSNYKLTRLKDDFYLTFTINPDENFLNLDLNSLKIQLTLYGENEGVKYSFFGEILETETGLVGRVKINTTGYINEDDKVELSNFISSLTVGSCNLINDAYLLIYSTTKLANDKDLTLLSLAESEDVQTVIYKEDLTLEFGKRLTYLYTNYDVNYTSRKYKTYDEDVYLTYEEDVYELDETGTPKLIPVDTDGDGEPDDVEFVILHRKGDPVLDDEGKPIIVHKAGDVVLDENGDPIIDYELGLEHILNLLLLEYPIRSATNPVYRDYRIALYKELTYTVTTELDDINSRILENTVIKFKPRNNLRDVKLVVNDTIYSVPNFINPVIDIYVVNTVLTPDLSTNFKLIAGRILQEGLRENKRISEITDDITKALGDNVVSVKIYNTDNIGDIDIKTYTPDSSRLVIDKRLSIGSDGTLLPELKVDVNIYNL